VRRGPPPGELPGKAHDGSGGAAAPHAPRLKEAARLGSEVVSRGAFDALPGGVRTLRVPPAIPPPPAARGLAAAAPRALVVDDDPEVCRALARLLRPELDVHLAGSVAQAEAVLARLDRVDLAFVDWELPDGTGEQILERLAAWPDAIRVLISARLSASGSSLGGVPSSEVLSSQNPLKDRSLANLVLGKPVARGVVDALKLAALALPQG
jgi:CheY-like chemotaxis protein